MLTLELWCNSVSEGVTKPQGGSTMLNMKRATPVWLELVTCSAGILCGIEENMHICVLVCDYSLNAV